MKPERKLFWRITDTPINVLSKTFPKRDFREASFDLGQLKLVEVPPKLGTIWEQLARQIPNSFFNEKC